VVLIGTGISVVIGVLVILRMAKIKI
jgi:hypothetical protein